MCSNWPTSYDCHLGNHWIFMESTWLSLGTSFPDSAFKWTNVLTLFWEGFCYKRFSNPWATSQVMEISRDSTKGERNLNYCGRDTKNTSVAPRTTTAGWAVVCPINLSFFFPPWKRPIRTLKEVSHKRKKSRSTYCKTWIMAIMELSLSDPPLRRTCHSVILSRVN